MNNPKMKLGKHIPSIRACQKIKYLGIHLTKQAHNLYSENYKTLLKNIKVDLGQWRLPMVMY